jgi:uncharacterized protein YgiM (DUF1202 family)
MGVNASAKEWLEIAQGILDLFHIGQPFYQMRHDGASLISLIFFGLAIAVPAAAIYFFQEISRAEKAAKTHTQDQKTHRWYRLLRWANGLGAIALMFLFIMLSVFTSGRPRNEQNGSQLYVTTRILRLHKSPTIKAPVLTTLPSGTNFRLVREVPNSGWRQIIVETMGDTEGAPREQLEGYINPYFYDGESFAKVENQLLLLHSRPSSKAPVLAKLPFGTRVRVVRELQNWKQITVETMGDTGRAPPKQLEGYVFKMMYRDVDQYGREVFLAQ